MSMPRTITLISPSKTTLISHPPPEIRTNTRRDASFSSYLDGAEESFVLKLDKKSSPNGKKSDDDDDDIELDVFGAEKYFNEAAVNPKPALIPQNRQLVPPTHHAPHQRPRPKKDELALEIFALKPQPSIRSESSCNSRSSFLQPVITSTRNQQQQQPSTKTNKQKLGFLARIGCKCSCADKSSVAVADEENKTGRRGGGPEKKRLAMTMMTWDAVVSPPEETRTIPSICGGDESDAGSDASSDLFEIESLSRGCKSPATACYAPSEASVEWSVVTASVADLEEPAGSGPKRAGPHREAARLRPGMLSGCMSQKSVRVSGGSGRNLRTESFTPARFHGEEIRFNRQRSGSVAAHLLHA